MVKHQQKTHICHHCQCCSRQSVRLFVSFDSQMRLFSFCLFPDYDEPKGWWTAGNYIARNQRWMWTTKHHLKEITYNRWAPLEPNARSTMHCMLLYKNAAYRWHDATCSDKHNFICEIEIVWGSRRLGKEVGLVFHFKVAMEFRSNGYQKNSSILCTKLYKTCEVSSRWAGLQNRRLYSRRTIQTMLWIQCSPAHAHRVQICYVILEVRRFGRKLTAVKLEVCSHSHWPAACTKLQMTM